MEVDLVNTVYAGRRTTQGYSRQFERILAEMKSLMVKMRQFRDCFSELALGAGELAVGPRG